MVNRLAYSRETLVESYEGTGWAFPFKTTFSMPHICVHNKGYKILNHVYFFQLYHSSFELSMHMNWKLSQHFNPLTHNGKEFNTSLLLWTILFVFLHLILSWYVIILSQGTLISLSILSWDSWFPLCLHSLLLISMLCMAMFFLSSFPFWCLTPHTCYASIMPYFLITVTHSPGLRVILYASSISRLDIIMYKPYE